MNRIISIHPVILCGGSGTRLWPLSRKASPKQFAKLVSENSLFEDAVRRVCAEPFGPATIVTGDRFRFIVEEQISKVGASSAKIIIEPDAKNTAPAVLAAALTLSADHPDGLMLVMPSDHLIPNDAAFRASVIAATGRAMAGDLITFGISPERPETGYGYLELQDAGSVTAQEPQPLVRFVEKPNAADAEKMIGTGRFLWNAGIFLFSIDAIIKSFIQHAPDVFEKVSASVAASSQDLGFTRLGKDAWQDINGISVDYAIMEKSKNLAVMPFADGWSDLGDWKSVWQESLKDKGGNASTGPITAIDCKNSLVRSEDDRIHVVGVGLDDMIVVATSDAVIVAPMAQSQIIGQAVAELKSKSVHQAENSNRDQRPWGWFESLSMGDRFQVKRILVKPGQALSLQSHNHRAEHWIVVAGTAKVTVGDEVKILQENQSVYIPLGAIHRLENPGDAPTEIIEVQTGGYLGEDDIIRYEDIYSRA